MNKFLSRLVAVLTPLLIASFCNSQSLSADVLFDMVPEPTDFTRDATNPDHSGTLTRGGIMALFTAQGNEGLEVPLGDLVFSADSFGMSIVDGLNNESLLDVSQSDTFGDIHEQIVVTFDRKVRVNEIVLDSFSSGDLATLSWGDSNSMSLGGSGAFTDVFDLTSQGILINPGEELTLLHVSGAGFSFESFRVTAVPEPGSIAFLGVSSLLVCIRRRRRKSVSKRLN